MDTEEKREVIVELVTRIVTEMNDQFHFNNEELNMLLEPLFKAMEKIAEKRMM